MLDAMTTDDEPSPPAEGMAWVPGGTFRMGSDEFYPEERPVRETAVEGFWMDVHPVTVREFRRFVKETGYVTLAERPVSAADYPDADPALLVPGSIVFRPTPGPVDLESRAWWHYVPGACWHRPEGLGSDTYTRGRHPVTHVAYEDAQAYAAWTGKSLSGSARRAAGSRAGGSRGATTRRRTASGWRTAGRASSRGRT
jgi:formylglycine-generating enzyme required for sulfatase activity